MPEWSRSRFTTLTFEREIAAPPHVVWEAWTAPAARALWSASTPAVTVEYSEADTRVGGREISICRAEGHADVRCEVGWLALQPQVLSMNTEVISAEVTTLSAALVTADLLGTPELSRLVVTVQLSSLAQNMEPGYREGFGAGPTVRSRNCDRRTGPLQGRCPVLVTSCRKRSHRRKAGVWG